MTARATAPAAHRPIRTCVGCRATVPQADLVRVAVVDGQVVADPRRRLPGRGAYVHARPACVAAAGKGLARSLRRGVSRAEVDGLAQAVRAAASGAAEGRSAVADGGGSGVGSTDPAMIPPGDADAEAVEIGSPSSTRTMSNPRPTPTATSANATRTTSAEGAERAR